MRQAMVDPRRTASQLWTGVEAAAADRYTIDELGVPSAILMERAALAVAGVVEQVRPPGKGRRADILCGPGNNGGDGLAVARMLAHRGWSVRAWLVSPRHSESVQAQRTLALTYGVEVHEGAPDQPLDASVIVDALLGTGSQGAPRGAVASTLAHLGRRSLGTPLVAVDLPTGLDAATGVPHEGCVAADHTVTFERSKLALHMGPACAYVGRVHVAEIGLRAGPSTPGSDCRLIDPADVAAALAQLMGARHKGERGHVSVVGGSPGTSGAALLAGEAALRAGAGLVTVASTAPEFAAAALQRCPELMHVLEWGSGGAPLPGRVLVVGPGWSEASKDPRANALWHDDARPAVWDAAGLAAVDARKSAGPRVLTPHPKEAARILARLGAGPAWTVARVQSDRVLAAKTLAAITGAVVVLKGVGSIVASGESIRVCVAGAASLATAGSGDVLAGAIGALIAQGRTAFQAACEGVHLHAAAGEALGASHGAVASDISLAIAQRLERGDTGARGAWPRLITG